MEQYISKSALVAEIENKKKYAQTLGDNAINSSMQQFYDGMKQGCVDILSFLDTLEVKEKDLDEAANEWDAKASFTPFYMTLDDKGSPNGVKQDYTTHAESFKAGAKWQIAKLMTNVIDAQCFGFQGAALFSFRLPADNYLVGSKVKVILINED